MEAQRGGQLSMWQITKRAASSRTPEPRMEQPAGVRGAATCALTLHVGTQSGRTLGGYKLSLQSKLRVEGPNRPQHVRINGPEGPREALLSLCQRPLIRKGSPQERARRPGGSTPLRYSE